MRAPDIGAAYSRIRARRLSPQCLSHGNKSCTKSRMSTASVLLVFLRDSVTGWADDHHFADYAKSASVRWSALRSSHFWTKSRPSSMGTSST